MNVKELREALSTMPDHLPVHVEVKADDAAGWDYFYTLECVVENFPSQGRMATVRLNYEPQ